MIKKTFNEVHCTHEDWRFITWPDKTVSRQCKDCFDTFDIQDIPNITTSYTLEYFEENIKASFLHHMELLKHPDVKIEE